MHSKKLMDILFAEGKPAFAAPLKLIYMESTGDHKFQAQAMFVVPKRQFKKAHDRNKLKRRMREAYRINKNALYNSLKQNNKKMILAFIFTGKKEESFDVINAAVLKLNAVIAR